MTSGQVESVNISRGGVPKTSVFEALATRDGLDGDYQDDTRYHGGPDRAVVLFSLDLIRALQAEGHPVGVGTTGENLTVSGLDWPALEPGAELEVGPVRLLITTYAAPCEKVSASFIDGDFARISQKVHPGWSRICARVLVEGIVRAGMTVHPTASHP
jgi:MOSC domain-containing protein YiiM